LTGGTLSVNSAFFADADGNGEPDLDDPNFFLSTLGVDPVHDARVAAWKRAGRIVTQISRFDMIQPEINRQNSRLLLSVGALPRITPLIRFQPARVSAETATPQVVIAAGQET